MVYVFPKIIYRITENNLQTFITKLNIYNFTALTKSQFLLLPKQESLKNSQVNLLPKRYLVT